MARFRFSLSALLAVTATAAVVFGVWRWNKHFGSSLVLMICLWTLCAATVAALSGPRRRRRLWLPFALFGWGYFWTSLGIHAFGLPGHAISQFAEWDYTADNSLDSGTLRLALEPLFALIFGLLGSLIYHALARFWPAQKNAQ